MHYTLFHGNIPVAEIEIDEEVAVIIKIGAVFAPLHIPVGVGVKEGQVSRADLNAWWRGRSIPASRQNVQAALAVLNLRTTPDLLTRSFGLSLSDQYWVNPVKNPLVWENINFFDNPFSDDVGNALFGNNQNTGDMDLLSPDNTSDGWLKKKWKIIDGKRYLIKGGSDPYQQEPLNEVLACAVMKRLGIPHVTYTVTFENEKPYSLCETFVTKETDLVSAWYVDKSMKQDNRDSRYTHLLWCAEMLDIPGVQHALEKMLVLDFIINNTDRHYNNFGFIRNAQTLEWYGLAPIYDCGTSLWHNVQSAGGKSESKPFKKTHNEQIKLVRDFEWFEFSALAGVDDEFSELLKLSPLITDKRRDMLCAALRNQIAQLTKY